LKTAHNLQDERLEAHRCIPGERRAVFDLNQCGSDTPLTTAFLGCRRTDENGCTGL
jgi:hypothetical protein